MSLEKAVIDKYGELVHSTNGWDVKHTCKAWDQVFDITESMHMRTKFEDA